MKHVDSVFRADVNPKTSFRVPNNKKKKRNSEEQNAEKPKKETQRNVMCFVVTISLDPRDTEIKFK